MQVERRHTTDLKFSDGEEASRSIFPESNITVHDSFEEAFTPERVKSRFESDIEDLNNVTEKECGDTYYTFTRKSEEDGHITMTKNLFKDKKYVVVTIDYDADKADKLGGDVAKHIFNSITIK